MTLPIRDILSLEKTKATRFGHHGLVIIVKGHEELFFESILFFPCPKALDFQRRMTFVLFVELSVGTNMSRTSGECSASSAESGSLIARALDLISGEMLRRGGETFRFGSDA